MRSAKEPPKVTSKIAQRRKEVGMSQEELARELDTSKTTVQNWENGRNLGALLRVRKLCQLLDMDIRDLVLLADDHYESDRG